MGFDLGLIIMLMHNLVLQLQHVT